MIGLDLRNDNIASVGLFHSEARRRLATVREDQIAEQSASPFVQVDARLCSFLRTVIGVRADSTDFNLTSSYQPFSGSDFTGIVSPKFSLVLGPWGGFDFYANAGSGFHSDDVRGASYTSSQTTRGVQEAPDHFPIPGGPPVERSALLVRTIGAEVGARLYRCDPWSTERVAVAARHRLGAGVSRGWRHNRPGPTQPSGRPRTVG